MTTNQILQKLQHIIGADAEGIHEIFLLGDYPLPRKRVDGYLSLEGDKAFLDCGYEALGHFLDGLIVYKRGSLKSPKDPEAVVSLDNNVILKKLRIAFELKDVDMFAIFDAVEIEITKSELNALFRKPGHKNYRICPDSILELFLDGLEICEQGLLE